MFLPEIEDFLGRHLPKESNLKVRKAHALCVIKGSGIILRTFKNLFLIYDIPEFLNEELVDLRSLANVAYFYLPAKKLCYGKDSVICAYLDIGNKILI